MSERSQAGQRAWELLLRMLRAEFRTDSTEDPEDIFFAGYGAGVGQGKKQGQTEMLEKVRKVFGAIESWKRKGVYIGIQMEMDRELDKLEEEVNGE